LKKPFLFFFIQHQPNCLKFSPYYGFNEPVIARSWPDWPLGSTQKQQTTKLSREALPPSDNTPNFVFSIAIEAARDISGRKRCSVFVAKMEEPDQN